MTENLTEASLTNNENGNKDILNNIIKLQDVEKELYKELAIISSTPGNETEQREIINRINEISNVRISLFKTLNQTSNIIQNSVSASRIDLVDQMILIDVVEKELNEAKTRMNQIDNITNEKLRMVEINTYYGKRYKAYTELMKLIIYISSVLLILVILNKKQIIPEKIGNGIMGLVVAVGIFFIIRKLVDIYFRDNMDFDQYEWLNIPDIANKQTVLEYDEAQLKQLGSGIDAEMSNLGTDVTNMASDLGLGCIGANCCSAKMKYDEKKNKCVDKLNTINEEESFTTMSFIGSNNVTTLNPENSVVKPFNTAVNYASV
jgi:hypothetical protein